MFICDGCANPIGPSISPIRVITETRIQHYQNKNSEGELVTSQGFEIVHEQILCATCAGVSDAKPSAESAVARH